MMLGCGLSMTYASYELYGRGLAAVFGIVSAIGLMAIIYERKNNENPTSQKHG